VQSLGRRSRSSQYPRTLVGGRPEDTRGLIPLAGP
jgi:hypothetical protein